MRDWELTTGEVEKTVKVEYLKMEPEVLDSGRGIGVDLTTEETNNKVVYFSAPPVYLGNKLSAYGGFLNYTIFYTTGLFGEFSFLNIVYYILEEYMIKMLKKERVRHLPDSCL